MCHWEVLGRIYYKWTSTTIFVVNFKKYPAVVGTFTDILDYWGQHSGLVGDEWSPVNIDTATWLCTCTWYPTGYTYSTQGQLRWQIFYCTNSMIVRVEWSPVRYITVYTCWYIQQIVLILMTPRTSGVWRCMGLPDMQRPWFSSLKTVLLKSRRDSNLRTTDEIVNLLNEYGARNNEMINGVMVTSLPH
jgi:hypothetical protein